jgi:UDP-N-acetylmuramoylalanine--D-glutamate ligase
LERINTFKPKIAVMLNFSCNHLDRYKNIEEYLEAKKRIYMNQDKSDYLVLNAQDPVVGELAGESKAKVIFFLEEQNLNPNQSAVLAVGSILGIDKGVCLDVFREFKGIEHRLEYVAEINNIRFINDSKATTVDSSLWALKNILEPVVLIAGGKDKGIDYRAILHLARKKVKEVILIGEAKEKIEEAFRGFLSIQKAPTLEDAVKQAYLKAKPGDCVLLSPMCSSFDMFGDYEERGRVFKKAVYDLAITYGSSRVRSEK